jgi:hypothetical protein
MQCTFCGGEHQPNAALAALGIPIAECPKIPDGVLVAIPRDGNLRESTVFVVGDDGVHVAYHKKLRVIDGGKQ